MSVLSNSQEQGCGADIGISLELSAKTTSSLFTDLLESAVAVKQKRPRDAKPFLKNLMVPRRGMNRPTLGADT